MPSYVSAEPTVVDDDLLHKAVKDEETQRSSHKATQSDFDIPLDVLNRGRTDPSEVTTLRLDFKNILKIDNLASYENLTKLQLDNNIIERMENLDFLVNLEWLDLSFNNISRIEGLSGLRKLTDLSLYNNRITAIENMDDLVSLQLLSIGNNAISELEQIEYLSRFPNLRVVNMAGNPLCKHADYKPYTIARVRNLKYLDYRLVEEASVAAAREKYIDVLIAIEQTEKETMERMEAEAKRAENEELLKKLHLDYVDQLYSQLFASNQDLNKYKPIAEQALTELFDDNRVKFEVSVTELRHLVQKQSDIRGEELVIFRRCVDEIKSDVDKECLRRIHLFYHDKKKILRQLADTHNPKDAANLVDTLKKEVRSLYNFLMAQEMTLVEQFEDVVKEVEQNYSQLCSTTLDLTRVFFQRMRDLANEWHEKSVELVMSAFEKFAKTEIDELDDVIRELISDKDALVNMVNGSHDYQISMIDRQEETLTQGVNLELELTVSGIQKDETERNRSRVVEISAFLERCNAEIEGIEEGM